MTGRIAVVGAGISGLTAAWLLQRQGRDVVVFDGAERVGGKVWTRPLQGEPFDVGADAFLARQPDFVELCEDLGLGHELVAPATGQVWLWFRDGLRRLPPRTIMGIPSDLDALASTGVLSHVGLSRARAEGALPPPSLAAHEDPPLRPFVVERWGDEVADRLVDPLLSGVYAGDISKLGLRSATPVLAALVDEAARHHTPLQSALTTRRIAAASDNSPVFKTVEGGLGRVVDTLVSRLDDVRVGTPIDALERTGAGWQVAGEGFDAVVVATPVDVAANLLEHHVPAAAGLLNEVVLASAVVVALAYPAGTRLPSGSGMLVPRSEGRFLKAATWSSQKWPHLADREGVVLRCSAGRVGDPDLASVSDAEIVGRVRSELAEAAGLEGPPDDVVVTRWQRAMPQYDSGHLLRMGAAVQEAQEHGVFLAGNAYEGVGLPACVRSARSAALRVAARLG